jgi:hypothetical protein
LRRRSLLLGVLALAATSCVRPRARTEAASPTTGLREAAGWNDEARDILRSALEPLRTFDAYAAYRISAAPSSSLRADWEFTWDPPSAVAWETATQGAYRLRARAARLHSTVASSTPDSALWRERRAFADATMLLSEMTEALAGYRARADRVSPHGDGSGALPVLQRAWEMWGSAADHWGVSRFEVITCA